MAAHPDARRTLAVLAALLFLPTASPAARPGKLPPAPAWLRNQDNAKEKNDLNGDADMSKTLSNSAIPDKKIATDAIVSRESQHFTLLTVKRGVERMGVLESAYTAFMAVTNVPENRLPAHLRVVIYRTKDDYKKTAHASGKWHYFDGEIATYEQKNMFSELIKALAAMLFDHTAKANGRKELVWLQEGVEDAVEAVTARVPLDERQTALRQELKTDKPVGINELVSQKVGAPKSPADKAEKAKRKMPRKTSAGAKRLHLTSVCLTYFLMGQDKSLSFSYLLKGLSEGKRLDDALSSAYPGKVRGLRELYNRWVTDDVSTVRPIGNLLQ